MLSSVRKRCPANSSVILPDVRCKTVAAARLPQAYLEGFVDHSLEVAHVKRNLTAPHTCQGGQEKMHHVAWRTGEVRICPSVKGYRRSVSKCAILPKSFNQCERKLIIKLSKWHAMWWYVTCLKCNPPIPIHSSIASVQKIIHSHSHPSIQKPIHSNSFPCQASNLKRQNIWTKGWSQLEASLLFDHVIWYQHSRWKNGRTLALNPGLCSDIAGVDKKQAPQHHLITNQFKWWCVK